MTEESVPIPSETIALSVDAVSALVPTDSLGSFKVYRADQLQRAGFYLLIYGATGSGKTTTAASIADSEYGRPALLVDVDRSSTAVSHRQDVDILYVYTWKDIQELFKIIQSPHKYSAIIIDNLSDLADLCFKYWEAIIQSKEPRQHYNAMTSSMLAMIKFMRDYAQKAGISLILTAWEGVQTNEIDGKRTIGLEFNPALQHRIGGLLGSVAYMDTDHTLYFGPHPTLRLITKLRRSPTDIAQTIPLTIQMPSLGPIANVMIGGKTYKV